MAGLASINIKFAADLKEFSSSMQNATRQMQKLGKDFTKVGKTLSVGLTAPIVGLGALAVASFASFEDSMAKVKAISGATATEFKALTDSAKNLGETTRFTASEVSALQLNFSKLGFNPQEILDATAATLDLALATGEDLAESAIVAASTLRGFGLSTSETTRVTDVMAKSFSSSALNLEKFNVAMSVLAPVAKTANVSLEEATGLLSVLINAGIDASTAGTGLRNVFLDLADKGISMSDAMKQIQESTNKNKTAMDLFGKRGATVANVLADNVEQAAKFTTTYLNASGSAKSMAEIMGQTLQGSFFKLKSAVEGAAIAFGDVLAPIIGEITTKITDLVSGFSKLSPETKKTIIIFGAFAAAIGPILVALGLMMTTVVPGLITAFGYLRASLLLLQGGFIKLTAIIAANPFGALAVVIAAIASYFIFFNKTTDETIKKQTLLAEINDTAAKSIANEKAKLAELLFIAKNENISKSARIKAIQELNALSPEFLGNLTLEKINTDEARKAVELYNLELIKTAKTKAAQTKLQDLESKMIDLQLASEKASIKSALSVNKLKKEAVSLEDQLKVRAIDKVGAGADVVDIYTVQIDKLKEQENQLLKIIAANQTLNKVVSTPTTKTPGGSGDAGTTRQKAVALDISAVGIKDFNIAAPLATEADLVDVSLNKMAASFSFFQENAGILTNAIGASFATMGNQISAVFQTGNAVLDAFVSSIVNALAELGAAFVQQLIIEKIFSGSKKTIDYGKASSSAIVVASNAAAAMGPVGVFALPGLIASQLGVVASSFAAIGAFENGGIVGGNSFSGDKLFAKINSGEMVLNKKQQGNVAGMIGAGSAQGVNVVLQPSLSISGDKIRVLLNRVDKSNARKR
jgi:hypothetical protein